MHAEILYSVEISTFRQKIQQTKQRESQTMDLCFTSTVIVLVSVKNKIDGIISSIWHNSHSTIRLLCDQCVQTPATKETYHSPFPQIKKIKIKNILGAGRQDKHRDIC